MKPHVTLRELYLRKEKGERDRMYRCGNNTCGKRRKSETACNIAGTVCAETAGRGKPHVQMQRVYLRKEKGERKRM